MDYYLHYPAIAVLFFPPAFALVEALFFGLFGVSHSTAQLTVSVFLLAVAYGTYFLIRCFVGRIAAFSTALLFLGTPIIALWGRQVMLELPAFAFLIWSCYFFLRYFVDQRSRDLYLAVLLLVIGTYTKQTVVFIVPAYLVTLYYVYRNTMFRRREVWWSGALFSAGMVPLGIFTWLWGRYNVDQSVGGPWVEYSRTSLAGWLYVPRQWPAEVGWIVVALAIVYCIGAIFWQHWRLPTQALFLFGAWLAAGYLFCTLIAIKTQRYTIFLTFTLVVFAVLAIVRGLPAKIAPYLVLILALATFSYRLIADPVPYISGYRAAAQYICSVAPADSIVLFSGSRDGSFIFNVRTTPECKNLTVIRADKLLLRVRMVRSMFGAQELGVSEDQFRQMLEQYGVSYIVIDPKFWGDLPSMQMLARLVHKDQFKLLTTIPISGNDKHDDLQLEIYRNLGPLSTGKRLLRVEIPVSGITIEGQVGKEK